MGKNINKLIACILLIPCISVLFSCKHSDLDDDSAYTNNVKSVSDIKNGFKYLGYIFYTDEHIIIGCRCVARKNFNPGFYGFKMIF